MTRRQRRNERKDVCHRLGVQYQAAWFKPTAEMPKSLRERWPKDNRHLLPD